jgi:hypothetical protein
MNEEQFFQWLSGFLELSKAETIDAAQLLIIKDHIALVQAETLRRPYQTYPVINPPPTHGNPFPTAPTPGPYGWEVTCQDLTPSFKEDELLKEANKGRDWKDKLVC